VPSAGSLDAVLGGHARSTTVVGREEARQVAPDDDCEGLCFAEMLSPRLSWRGELVAEHANVLVFSLVGAERLAEDLTRSAQSG
jgi:hypothetical protein